MVAEITATQAILIDLFCVLGRDGRIATAKAQEIVDRAHNSKFQEALELLRLAYSKAAKLRFAGPGLGDYPQRSNERVGWSTVRSPERIQIYRIHGESNVEQLPIFQSQESATSNRHRGRNRLTAEKQRRVKLGAPAHRPALQHSSPAAKRLRS
jgi:hypothetical protein